MFHEVRDILPGDVGKEAFLFFLKTQPEGSGIFLQYPVLTPRTLRPVCPVAPGL